MSGQLTMGLKQIIGSVLLVMALPVAATAIPNDYDHSGAVVSGGGSAADGSGLRNQNVSIGSWVFPPLRRPATELPRTGDTNGDGRIDIADVLLALQADIGLVQLSTPEVLRADVAPLVSGTPQGDGKIGIDDVILILRKAVGLQW